MDRGGDRAVQLDVRGVGPCEVVVDGDVAHHSTVARRSDTTCST
jgi:hypothetical protein